MSAPETCPNCGTELPPDAPAGLCPKCLVAAGLQSQLGSAGGLPNSAPEAPTIESPSPGGVFQPPSPTQLADKFPQFEILGLLGHGGMGAVYKARQKNLDRLVALKIIRPEVTHDPAFAERFNREARTLARLSHQHIVGVHDFGEIAFSASADQPAQRLYYFVMEYVDGANLRQLMQSGELAPDQALAIVPQICDALQYAHDEGVVHRDIKPENILLDQRGRVKIADFGLAKLTTPSDAEFTLTCTHQVMGTLRYMAPEQLEGSHSVDHRADIYSLGVVFYEMLTGEAPMGHFDPPSKKAEVDVRLDEVVLRSLAREPERRYQHASNVKTDVESISSTSHSLPATPTGHVALDGSEQVSQQMETPAALLLIAGVALCLAGAIMFVLYLGRQIVEDPLLVFGMVAGLFVVGGALVVAGTQLQRLQGYGVGVAAGLVLLPVSTVVPAVFSQSNSPWMFAPLVLLLPVALWLLWTLSRDEVKHAFEQRSLSVNREQASASRRDEFNGRPRFSIKALVGALLASISAMACAVSVYIVLGDPPPLDRPIIWCAMVSVLTGLASTFMGAIALYDFRYSRAPLIGIEIACFDTLFFPLVLLDGAIFGVAYYVVSAIDPNAIRPDAAIALVIALLICVPLNLWIVLRAWRAITGSRTDPLGPADESRLASAVALHSDNKQR